MSPVVLIAHSLRWSNASRLSITCKNAGFTVAAVAIRDHPVHTMRSPDRTFVYAPRNPRASLRKAIELSGAQLIIPCDDRVVGHLHALHASAARNGDPIAKVIETSLGPSESYEPLKRRSLLSELASLPHVRVPRTDDIASLKGLKAWVDAHGLPAVLKLDGRTGGEDVMQVTSHAKLAMAFVSMKLRQSGLRSLWNAVKRRDIEPMLTELRDGRPAMSAQAMVAGRPANCAVACWRGEVLGFVAVEAVRTQSAFGASTVVRQVEGRDMRAAAESIVRHLGMSGMCGFDFIIDDRSGEVILIEINPRATQINHFPLGPEADLSTKLLCALEGGRSAPPSLETLPETDIALFPQEWLRDPTSPYIRNAYHDAPYEEPELLRHYGYEPSAADAAARHANVAPARPERDAGAPVEAIARRLSVS